MVDNVRRLLHAMETLEWYAESGLSAPTRQKTYREVADRLASIDTGGDEYLVALHTAAQMRLNHLTETEQLTKET